MLPGEIPEVGAPEMEEAEPLPGEHMEEGRHGDCPFHNKGHCLVLNEPISELGKDDAVGGDEGDENDYDEEGEFEEL